MIIEASSLEHFGVKGMHWGQHKGKTLTPIQAQRREANIQIAKKLAIAGAAYAAILLASQGSNVSSAIMTRAETNRGRASIPSIMANAADLAYSKKHHGVYNITTM